jgi:V/A-type H+-transporting ATPase subunit G/H
MPMAESETLKRLLAAESKAEEIIASADRQRAALIEQGKRDAQAAQTKHAQDMAEIVASFMAQAEQRAAQTIAELRRRYAERSDAMKAAAELTQAQALDAAVSLLTGRRKSQP